MDHGQPSFSYDARLTPEPSLFKDFLTLTKPGIIFGNPISVMGGFFLTAQGAFDSLLFIAVLVALVMGICWLYLGLQGYRTRDDEKRAKRVFGFSILTITALSVMMSLDASLPASPMLWTSLY